MTHEERLELMQATARRLVERHPGEVELVFAVGSVARGTDTPWSDVDMTAVVTEKSALPSRHFLCRGTAVGVVTIKRGRLEEILARPCAEWPFWMGCLSVAKVLQGDPALVAEWLRLGRSAPDEAFRSALEELLPELVVESYGRILSCRERGDDRDAWPCVLEVLWEMQKALCLLNRSWVTHDYHGGFEDTLAFEKLPEGWPGLVWQLWSARSLDEIEPLATQLVEAYYRLLAREGIEMKDYPSAGELPL
jgi:kanamycin nucleotidyltransferase